MFYVIIYKKKLKFDVPFNFQTQSFMKQYSLLLVVFLSAIGMQAQDARSFSLNLYGGYNFSDELDYDGYSATIEDGFQYGAGFEYFFSTNNSVELKYLRSDVKIPFYGPAGNQLNAGNDKGAFNFILADFTHYFDTYCTEIDTLLLISITFI